MVWPGMTTRVLLGIVGRGKDGSSVACGLTAVRGGEGAGGVVLPLCSATLLSRCRAAIWVVLGGEQARELGWF